MTFSFQWLTRVNQTISPFKGQNPLEGQATGGPTTWMYNATSSGANDSTATVEAANYFLGASGFLGVGDWIICNTNNPNYLLLNVTAVTVGTTVTTQTFTASSSGVTFSGALVSGNFPKWSGTTGLTVDSGVAVSALATYTGATVSGNVAKFNNTTGQTIDSGVAVTDLLKLDAVNTLTGSGQIILVKANGTEAANAVTASGNAGVITTSSLTTAGGSSYAITWTNTLIAATSVINLTIMGGTNTTENITLKATAGAGSSTLTIYNNTAATSLNGTILIGYTVF